MNKGNMLKLAAHLRTLEGYEFKMNDPCRCIRGHASLMVDPDAIDMDHKDSLSLEFTGLDPEQMSKLEFPRIESSLIDYNISNIEAADFVEDIAHGRVVFDGENWVRK